MMTVETVISDMPCGTGGVSVSKAGEIYVADFGAILGDEETMGTRVFKVSSEGDTSVFANGFKGASGNEFDSKGNLFQSSIRGNCVSKISADGGVSDFADQGILGPVGIVVDLKDELFVANCVGNSIQRISATGESTLFVKSSLFCCPNGLTLDYQGNLYVANFDNGDVLRVDQNKEVTRLATIPGNNNGHITFLDNALYVVGRTAHQIFRVSLDGEISVFAGSGQKGRKDGSLLNAEFCYPNDIALSHDHSCFYVNDIADISTEGIKLGPTALRRIQLG